MLEPLVQLGHRRLVAPAVKERNKLNKSLIRRYYLILPSDHIHVDGRKSVVLKNMYIIHHQMKKQAFHH